MPHEDDAAAGVRGERSLLVAWDDLSKVEAWPSWAEHIRRVRLDPPGELTARSRGRFLLRAGPRSTFTMTEFDPAHELDLVGLFLWLTIRYDHRFEPIDEHHTRLAWTVAAKRPRIGLLGRVFAAGYGRNLDSGHPQPAARAGWSRALASRRLVAITVAAPPT